MLTSNRSPAEWPDLFGDPLLASAGLDRLADNAYTLVITGSSFRAKRRELKMQKEVMNVDSDEQFIRSDD